MRKSDGTTPLAYKGEVDLEIRINGKVITLHQHNSGEEYLKKAFAKFLTGYGSRYDIPSYIDLRHSEDETWPDEGESWLFDKVPLSSKKYQQVTQTQNWQAVFTAPITYDYLLEPILVTTSGYFRFYLYTVENDTVSPTEEPHKLAWISVSKEDLANLVEGAEAIVYWNMMLLNASEIEEESE